MGEIGKHPEGVNWTGNRRDVLGFFVRGATTAATVGRLPAAVGVTAWLESACKTGDGDEHDDSTSLAGSVEDESRIVDIEMTDNDFSEGEITVGHGEQVSFRYTNNGQQVHNAMPGEGGEGGAVHHEGGGGFPTSRNLERGDTQTVTGSFAGDTTMHCHFHPGMEFEVVVDHDSMAG